MLKKVAVYWGIAAAIYIVWALLEWLIDGRITPDNVDTIMANMFAISVYLNRELIVSGKNKDFELRSHWLRKESDINDMGYIYECAHCGNLVTHEMCAPNYCPLCGCRMDKTDII